MFRKLCLDIGEVKKAVRHAYWSGSLLSYFAFFVFLSSYFSLLLLIYSSFPIIVLFSLTFFCLFVAVGGIGVWEDGYSRSLFTQMNV